MFRRTLIFCSLFFAATSSVAYWDHCRIRPKDRAAYPKLVVAQAKQRSMRALHGEPIEQIREQVQKDFWIPSGSERLHFRLRSAYSELVLKEKRGKIAAVEHLRSIEALLQEEMKEGVQQVRSLVADQGVYAYPSHHFLAQTVCFHFYRMPGTDLPETIDPDLAFLQGFAEEAGFSALGHRPLFTATRFHAELDPTKGLP